LINTLIGNSPDYLYLHGRRPRKVSDLHRPYFLAFNSEQYTIENSRKFLINKWEENKDKDNPLGKIIDIGEIERYNSFWDFNKKRDVFKVYTKKSYFVPEVSDYLFFYMNMYTSEHDIPYQQRSLVDICSEKNTWIFDSGGDKKNLRVLVYDIETTEYGKGKTDIPVDIIGYTDFDLSFESEKNLDKEEFSFEIIDCPNNWEDGEVKQIVSNNIDEEIDNLNLFCKKIMNSHIISGHNIVGFDNFQIYNRLNFFLKNHSDIISKEQKNVFNDFLNKYSRIDKSFHFGISSQVVQFYPTSLDTYLGVRKFYHFLNDFSLKAVAPFLGIHIKDRLILTPSQIKIDDRTLKYNKHDVQEQLGVTLNLIQQALPLAFTTCMPFDMLLSSGAVNMWDHMSMIRATVQKKIMPPTCRVMGVSKTLCRDFNGCNNKKDIVKRAKKKKDELSKEFVRVVKYGDEMPYWMEDADVIYNVNAKDSDDRLNYHFPGGMTIKPDKDANSDFIPWYYVIVADVGAMYPTILKAMNIGADTVCLARKDEKPDDWIWLKKIPKGFLDKRDILYRDISSSESYADKGYMIGVKIDKRPGVVNCSMTGILSMISKIKKELKNYDKSNDQSYLQSLKMMYQSVKGARNAGTHGILSAPNVSGRQFNLWGAAAITTKGQAILSDTLDYLKSNDIRVVYGDTDGIYLGCSRSAENVEDLCDIFKLSCDESSNNWLTNPEVALNSIEKCNDKWRDNLNYIDFELEPELHDCMIFVKHKNYLIFDTNNSNIIMNTKGNNFKGSDKANIARKVLKKIMFEVIKENHTWNNEEDVRSKVKNCIIEKTKEIVSNLDLSKVDIEDLTLIQSVQPASRYKTNQDGSLSTFAKRASCLENVLGYPIKNRIKLKFVVTKRCLPGITNPSKSGVKPIDFMYPVDKLDDISQIDLKWYKEMIENYIQGAFGLSGVKSTEQKGLDEWM